MLLELMLRAPSILCADLFGKYITPLSLFRDGEIRVGLCPQKFSRSKPVSMHDLVSILAVTLVANTQNNFFACADEEERMSSQFDSDDECCLLLDELVSAVVREPSSADRFQTFLVPLESDTDSFDEFSSEDDSDSEDEWMFESSIVEGRDFLNPFTFQDFEMSLEHNLFTIVESDDETLSEESEDEDEPLLGQAPNFRDVTDEVLLQDEIYQMVHQIAADPERWVPTGEVPPFHSWMEKMQAFPLYESCRAFVYDQASKIVGGAILDSFTSELYDQLINVFETTSMMMFSLTKCCDWQGIVFVLVMGYKMLTRRNVIGDVINLTSKITKLLKGYMPEGIASYGVENLQSGFSCSSFEEFIDTCRSMVKNYKTVMDSPVVKKVKSMFMYVLSFGIFESFGVSFESFNYDDIEASYLRRRHTSKADFVLSVFDGITFIIQRGMQAIKTGSLLPLFHSEETYVKWVETAQRLEEDSHKLMNATAAGIDLHEFTKDLDECIIEGESIVKYADKGKEKMMLSGLLRSLRIIRCVRLTRKFAQEERDVPYSLVLHGDSSVGKSKMKEFLFYLFGTAFDLPVDDRFKYTRCPSDEYWSGFDSGVWCLILDDIALLNPTKAVNDPSTSALIPIINGVPFNPPMAIAEEKGTCSLRAKFVIATTNQQDLNARLFYNCPLAVLRRFRLFVELCVHPDYAQEANPTMLDPAKAARCEDEWPNYWNIKVSRVVAVPPKKGETLCGYKFDPVFDEPIDIFTFASFVVENAKAFRTYQAMDIESTTSMRSVTMCKKCIAPSSRCHCAEKVQARPIYDGNAGYEDAILENHALFRESVKFSHNGVEYPLSLTKEKLENEDAARYETRMRALYDLLLLHSSLSDDETPSFDEATEADLDKALVENYAPWVYSRPETLTEYFTDKMDLVVSVARFAYRAIVSGVSHIAKSLLETANRTVAWMCCEGLKNQLAEMGKQALAKLSDPKLQVLAMCVAGVATGWAAWKMFFNQPEAVQGTVSSKEVGSAPEVKADETENVWKTKELMCHPVDFGQTTQSMKGLTADEFISRYSKHIIHIAVRFVQNGEKMVTHGSAFCTGGHLCVTDNHIFPLGPESFQVEMIAYAPEPGISANLSRVFLEADLDRVPHRDLVFFLHEWPSMKNMKGFFAQNALEGASFSGRIITRRQGGNLDSIPFTAAHREQHYVQKLDLTIPMWNARVVQDTVMGDCGSIYLTTGYPTILGLHQIGSSGRACAIEILQSDIVSAMQRMKCVVVDPGCPQTEATKVGAIHFKSPLMFVEKGRAIVHGTLIGASRSKFKSKVEKTLMHDAAVEEGFQSKVGRPTVTGNGWKPKRTGLMPIVEQQSLISGSILRECSDAFVHEILEMLPRDQLDELKIVDNLTAINGRPGVKFIDAMKRRTSMGFPYRKSKKFYIEPLEESDIWQDGVDFTPEIYKEVERIWTCYQEGKRAYPVFTSVLKDEVLPQKKIDIEKLRVFSVGPGPWSMVVRKMLITFVRVFQNNPYVFEGAPGMNCCSMEWKTLYEYLTTFGKDSNIAGDFRAFDKGAEPVIVREAFYVIRCILEKAGWPEDDLHVIDCIAEDVAYPLTDFFGDLITLLGSNPSGQPLTVIVNCIINALYMRYVMRVVNPEFDLKDFKKFVHLITYGDDNASNVHSSLKSVYNHTVIANTLKTIGVVYTMADKEAESIPFIPIEDVSFLKRTWRWDPDVAGGAWMAPLDWASVDKMMTWWVGSDFMCAEDHAVMTMSNVIREAFQYGRVKFEDTRGRLLRIAEKIDLFLPPGTLPTWDQCCDSYEKGALTLSPAV